MVNSLRKFIWCTSWISSLGGVGFSMSSHSLHGLKQSLRAWIGRFSFVVQQFVMSRSKTDHLFSIDIMVQKRTFIWLSVLMTLSWSKMIISQLKQHLFSQHSNQRLGEIKVFFRNWGSTIQDKYHYLTNKIRFGHIRGDIHVKLQTSWHSYGSKRQTYFYPRGSHWYILVDIED